MIRTPLISLLIPELSLINFIPRNLFEQIKFFIVYPIRVVPPYFIVYDPLISLTTDVLHDAIAGIIDWFIIIALITPITKNFLYFFSKKHLPTLIVSTVYISYAQVIIPKQLVQSILHPFNYTVTLY